MLAKPVPGNLAWEPVPGKLFLGTLAWEPLPENLAWEPLAGNPCLGTGSWEPCLRTLLGTSSWEPCLGTLPGNLAWEPVPGNLLLGTLAWEPVPGNLAWEPLAGNPVPNLAPCRSGCPEGFSRKRKLLPGTFPGTRFPADLAAPTCSGTFTMAEDPKLTLLGKKLPNA